MAMSVFVKQCIKNTNCQYDPGSETCNTFVIFLHAGRTKSARFQISRRRTRSGNSAQEFKANLVHGLTLVLSVLIVLFRRRRTIYSSGSSFGPPYRRPLIPSLDQRGPRDQGPAPRGWGISGSLASLVSQLANLMLIVRV